MKTTIYLADLTHQGLVLSSNVFPLSIGLIAAYLLDRRPEKYSIELFKYPSDLSNAFEKKKPDVIAFANYSWNFQLGYQYVKQIKKIWPEVVVIFGGPNYGLTVPEVNQFWSKYNLIDFYIVKEGEQAFLELIDSLAEFGFNATEIKKRKLDLKNCHYIYGSEVLMGGDLPRVNIENSPSPYLMGLMDKFFDESLAPLIHTTRGCPFSCSFCTEGSPYYNIVEQRLDGLNEELEYIAKRIKGPRDLFISDANFGMFKQDIEKAKLLASCQKKYKFPQNIHVSTGKNQKERVVEVAEMLDGAISMAASLQSTDEQILKNVSRSNISIDKLKHVGKLANKVEAGTYSEIILGLPGDSFNAHCKSLKDCVSANFDNIRMYQLIMLPQTELNTPESRDKFEMITRHRVMPRSFGRYSLNGSEFVAVESEEILIENKTLTFQEYINCRELDFTVELLHNGKVYEEIQSLCTLFGLSWFDFILRFYENRMNHSEKISEMYDQFKNGLQKGLWIDRDELEEYVNQNIDEMLTDERGTNEMSMGKATGFFVLFEEMNRAVFDEFKSWLRELKLLTTLNSDYIDSMEIFSQLRKFSLMNFGLKVEETFCFDLEAIVESKFTNNIEAVVLEESKTFTFTHDDIQLEKIQSYAKEFGLHHDGIGKMLMRYPHIHRLFRSPKRI
jgi:radical SAM superfamily enzyme YgiQ (UPF0313 family)